MVKIKTRKFYQWLIVIFVIAIGLFGLVSLSRNSVITKENAVAKIKMLPEVKTYLKKVPNGFVIINGEENNEYLVQVYESKNGHTATFNWYKVNKTTGSIKKEF